MHFAQTRISTIDTYCVFFTLAMYYTMLLFVTSRFEDAPARQYIPLALCGISFGLGAASKWQCFYAAVGLVVIYIMYIVREGLRLTREGKGDIFRRRLLGILAVSVVFFVGAAGAIYYFSYLPYARANGETLTLKYVWDRQLFMYDYHANLEATHPYESQWYMWLVGARPILYYREAVEGGKTALIASFTGPVITWAGLAALAGECILTFRKKAGAYIEADASRARTVFLMVGWLAMLLPWVTITRCAFAYHYFPCTIFLALALMAAFDRLWAYRAEGESGLSARAVHAMPFILAAAAVVLFMMFYPVLSGAGATNFWLKNVLKWMPSWPF